MPTLSRRAWLGACTGLVAAAAFRSNASAHDRTPADEQSAGQPPWALGPFVRLHEGQPILAPRSDTSFVCPIRGRAVSWEAKDVFNPAAVVRGGLVHLLYRAQDAEGRPAGTSRIGLATSRDGVQFTSRPQPVLYPADDEWRRYEWEGGCEDPRVVEAEDGRYVMTYTAYDGRTARLFIASSRDLVTWTKHGPAFARAVDGRYRDTWSKSGAIVCVRQGDRLVASRVGGRFWMYWGDTDVFLASSDDLVQWTPVESEARGGGPPSLVVALATRRGRFDSALVEPGPPAMVTSDGILLLYNGANRQATGDTQLPEMAYSAGQALFDPADPAALIGRATAPFLTVRAGHELTGQVGNVCFIEGLVLFNGRWLLYYGMGDSRIGVVAAPA